MDNAADIAELRDIAEWFEARGHKQNGQFLRGVANRLAAYAPATCKDSLTVEDLANCGLLSEMDD